MPSLALSAAALAGRRRGQMSINGLMVAAALIAFAGPAVGAGIDSRTYSCAQLHSLIAAQRFVFISAATFGDFVVANASFCGGGEYVETRSVATADRAECPVNYCASFSSGFGN